jgi:hypothetical protein
VRLVSPSGIFALTATASQKLLRLLQICCISDGLFSLVGSPGYYSLVLSISTSLTTNESQYFSEMPPPRVVCNRPFRTVDTSSAIFNLFGQR